MTLVWALCRGKMDKYKDKDKDEVTAESLAKALGVDVGMNLVSGIPLIPDLGEYFVKKTMGESAYSIDVTSVALIMDTVDAVSKVTKLAIKDITGEGGDLETHARTLWDAGEDISKALGIPMENVTNLFNAGYRHTVTAAMGKYRGEYEAMKMTTDMRTSPAGFYDNLYKAMVKDRAAYQEIYADMVEHGISPEKIKSAMETRMKKAQEVKSVSELDHRYVAPEDEADFDEAMGRLEGSRLWRKASPEQRDKAEDIVYNLVVGDSKASQTTLDKLAGTGIDEGTYALYKLAAEMADEASDDNGSITNAEREAAIRSMEGLSDAKRAALWVIGGGKDKSNPWG